MFAVNCDVSSYSRLGQTLATMRDMPTACGPQQRDLLCSGTKMFLFWCLPSFAFALGFMGTVCLLNASRCGRIHCYLTGPFFISVLLLPWDMVLGSCRLGRPVGNGLVT